MSGFRWSTVIKLIVASLIVGTLLAFIGADPFDIWKGIAEALKDGVEWVFGTGWNGVQAALKYTVLGAAVVVPVYVISLLVGRAQRRGRKDVERE